MSTTSSKLEQLPFTMVHRRTVLCQAVTPVTSDVAELMLVIEPAPLILVHVPCPTEAALAARVKVEVAHWA